MDDVVTCVYGYYPYCPLFEHGYVRVEEWMREDECEWVCLLDADKKERQNVTSEI